MRPKCPKCGEPARVVLVKKAYVWCALNDDGSRGALLSAYGAIPDDVLIYRCGGYHEFQSNEEEGQNG